MCKKIFSIDFLIFIILLSFSLFCLKSIYSTLKDLYNYIFVYKKGEGKILEKQKEIYYDGEMYSERFIYKIRFLPKNYNQPIEVWVYGPKNYNTNDIIKFKYDESNPEELLFETVKSGWFLVLIGFIFFIFSFGLSLIFFYLTFFMK